MNASDIAINFALNTKDGVDFLRSWHEGDYEACRKQWPNAPKECYVERESVYRFFNWHDDEIHSEYVPAGTAPDKAARLALQQAVKAGVDLSGLVLTATDLSGLNLTGAKLAGSILDNCDFSNSILVSADLSRASLCSTNLRQANLRYAELEAANLYRANAKDASFRSAQLSRANLSCVDATAASFVKANLRNATLEDMDFSRAHMTGAILLEADLTGSRLNFFSMDSVVGEGLRIKTMHTDSWLVVYTKDDMQIGCELHPIEDWWKFTDTEISQMDAAASSWWGKWKPLLQQILKLSPAR